MKCLSVRQPWPWFTFHSGKDVENRDWTEKYTKSMMTLCPVGTNVLIHAAQGCTEEEFADACYFASGIGVTMFPKYEELERGGIVGMVRIAGYVRHTSSKWFMGTRLGIKWEDPYPMPFQPCRGLLGFFDFPTELNKTPTKDT